MLNCNRLTTCSSNRNTEIAVYVGNIWNRQRLVLYKTLM